VGRELWKYYHSIETKHNQFSSFNVNAGLYDIREFFKGRTESGRINTKSDDKKFNTLDTNLKDALKVLAEKITPKVYEYGFLLE
jgi:hypothetical protein